MDAMIIADYSPAWPEPFAVIAAQLRTALGDVAMRIDHIGSTAVPGLAAKPCVPRRRGEMEVIATGRPPPRGIRGCQVPDRRAGLSRVDQQDRLHS